MDDTQRAAIAALLQRSGREFVPLRREFVQLGGGKKRGGPLAAFVKRPYALDLYLLLHAVASSSPWDVVLPGRVWARLLGLPERSSTAVALVSRQWSWLEEQRLVDTERAQRHRRVRMLREDATGRQYFHPGVAHGGQPAEGSYFRLPHAYWAGGFADRLSLSAKSVLLIALSLQDGFLLPIEHASGWYDLSPERIQAGLKTLRAVGVLDMTTRRREAPLTERGFTFERRYTLRPPFRDMDDLPVT